MSATASSPDSQVAAGLFALAISGIYLICLSDMLIKHRAQDEHSAVTKAYTAAVDSAEGAAKRRLRLAAASDFEAASYPQDVSTLRESDVAGFMKAAAAAALQGGPVKSRAQGEAECRKDYLEGDGDKVCLPHLQLSYTDALVQAKDAARLAIQEQVSAEFARTGVLPAGLEAAYTAKASAFQSAALPMLISWVTSGQVTADQAVEMFDVSLEPERLNSGPLQRMNATAISRLSRALPEPS